MADEIGFSFFIPILLCCVTGPQQKPIWSAIFDWRDPFKLHLQIDS